MVSVVRWVSAFVLGLHALIHFMGAAKGLGWAEVDQLAGPISPGWGVVWLVAGSVALVAALLLGLDRPRWWWTVGAAAAALSQLAIVSAWSEAKAGTAANLLLVVWSVMGWAASRRHALAPTPTEPAEARVVADPGRDAV